MNEALLPQEAIDERRRGDRYPFKFQCAVVYHQYPDADTRPTYYGKTWDISISGMSFAGGWNIFTEDDITVLIAVPSRKYGGRKRIVECIATMCYTTYSQEVDGFRVGIAFKTFKGSGRKTLRDVLQTHRPISGVSKEAKSYGTGPR